MVTSFKEISNNILPYLSHSQYRLKGSKLKNFEDFNKVSEMMVQKEHLNEAGLAKIIEIKQGMNRSRAA